MRALNNFYKKTEGIAVFLFTAITFFSCTIDNGEDIYGYDYDKEQILVSDLNSTIKEYGEMMQVGFNTMLWDTASEEERIVLENTLMAGYLFKKGETKWQVEKYYNKFYVDINRSVEGEITDILVIGINKIPASAIALFDTCSMVATSEDKWKVTIQASTSTDYNLYNMGNAVLNVEITKKYEDSYPLLLSINGEGTYETQKLSGEANSLEIEWKIIEGVLQNGSYPYMETYQYSIKVGRQGDKKTIIEVINTDNGDIITSKNTD